MALSISRTKRDIKRLRLERALLFEKLDEQTSSSKIADGDAAHYNNNNNDTGMESPSPPHSPSTSIGRLSQSFLEAAAAAVAAGAQQAFQTTGSYGVFGPPSILGNYADAAASPVSNGKRAAADKGALGSASAAAPARGGPRGRGSKKHQEAALAAGAATGSSSSSSSSAGNSHLSSAGNGTKAGSAVAATGSDNDDAGNDSVDEDDFPEPAATKTKRAHAPRDPNLPRRPQNAYIIFCELEKEAVKAKMERERPGLPYDLTKAMSDAWHTVPREKRGKYYQIYLADKERYAREMANYSSPNPTPSEQRERLRFQRMYQEILEQREQAEKNGNGAVDASTDDADATAAADAAAAAATAGDEEQDVDLEHNIEEEDHEHHAHHVEPAAEVTTVEHSEHTAQVHNEEEDDEEDEDDEDEEDDEDDEDDEDEEEVNPGEYEDGPHFVQTHIQEPISAAPLLEPQAVLVQHTEAHAPNPPQPAEGSLISEHAHNEDVDMS